MIIIKLVITVLIGITGHQMHKPTQDFGPRWGSLLRYAIGLLLFIPCNLIIKSSLPSPKDGEGEMSNDIISSLLAAGALGSGVLIGYFSDKVSE